MTIELTAVTEIVASVFESMLGLSLRQSPVPWSAGIDRLTSSVHLTGEWNGAVAVECTRLQARCFTARFLAMEVPPDVDDVVRDVLGELANMIGGNLKSALCRGIHLSMPSVIDGIYNWRVCGAEGSERLAFSCDEGVFWVTVLSGMSVAA